MAYSALILFFIAIWLVAFVLRAELRRALLLVSLVIAPLGPLSEFWFLRDYWARETLSGAYIGVEDVLFSFFLGGVTFAIYKVVFWATLSKKHPSFGYLPLYTAFITISFLLVLTNLLGVNSILSSSLGFIATSA